MKIGIVSDTHDHLANVARIVELFRTAGVERVIHTGDVTRPKTLDLFARLATPIVGVYGNNDEGERDGLENAAVRHGFGWHDGPLVLDWCERRIVVVHDPRTLARVDLSATDLALHGHDHRLVVARGERVLVFNPGECAGQLAGHNCVGVIDLALPGPLTPELLRF